MFHFITNVLSPQLMPEKEPHINLMFISFLIPHCSPSTSSRITSTLLGVREWWNSKSLFSLLGISRRNLIQIIEDFTYIFLLCALPPPSPSFSRLLLMVRSTSWWSFVYFSSKIDECERSCIQGWRVKFEVEKSERRRKWWWWDDEGEKNEKKNVEWIAKNEKKKWRFVYKRNISPFELSKMKRVETKERKILFSRVLVGMEWRKQAPSSVEIALASFAAWCCCGMLERFLHRTAPM